VLRFVLHERNLLGAGKYVSDNSYSTSSMPAKPALASGGRDDLFVSGA
jgi:hypothetical protein